MKVKIKNIISGLIAALMITIAVPIVASAEQENTGEEGSSSKCDTSFTIFPRWYDNGLCDPTTGGVKSPNDFDSDTATGLRTWASKIALNIVSIILYAVGYVSLGFIIYGGFKYMTSGDNSGGRAASQKTIINAVIGLVLSIMSVAIVTFVAGAIG